MKWFKHYCNAHTSSKLNLLMDKYGLDGYARYWLLVELLSEKFDGSTTTFTIHRRTLAKHLRYNKHTSAEQWLNNGATMGLFECSADGDLVTIVFDKLLKIKDNHTKNLQVKSKQLALREDKNRKEKNRVYTITPDDVVELYNNTLGQDIGYCRGLGGRNHLEKFIESTEWLKDKDAWQELFNICKKSTYLMGKENDWCVNLTWLVDYDNAVKVLNGNFKNGSNGKKITASQFMPSIELSHGDV